MAAYAALVSLMNTMDQIQIHPRVSTFFNKNQLESLGDTVCFLLDFIESYNCGGRSKEVEDLEGQITCAAHAAEDVIESHIVDHYIVDQILVGSTNKKEKSGFLQKMMRHIRKKTMKLHLPCLIYDAQNKPEDMDSINLPSAICDLQVVTEDMDSIKENVRSVEKQGRFKNQTQQAVAASSWPVSVSAGKTATMVGFDDYLYHLLEKLTGLPDHQLVIPIIGLGGVDNNNGGRIVLTSRLHDISLNFNSPYLAINFLDEDKSWNLFCQESFGEEGCPAELEKIGKKICENCKGLPLSIVVIGGFLRKSSKTRVYWKGVARDIYSVLNSEEDNECMSILSLSYNHLSAHLKPCSLYLGVFAEDESIPVSRLIKLWVAEGFLRPNDGKSLEEVAEGYLQDLVDRNLILVNRWGSTGKMRACNIHDLVRELCLLVAKKEKFLCVMKFLDTPRALDRERRIVIHKRNFDHDLSSASLVRSLICKGSRKFDFRLLRVLSVVERIWDIGFLEADFWFVNLRYLESLYELQSFPTFRNIPRKISLPWNLQTSRIKGYDGQIIGPSEIWEMVQLRHLEVDNLYVPDPRPNDREDLALPNLQTLCKAMNFRLSEEVCKRIPNVKKLHLEYNEFSEYSELPQRCDAASYYCPQNLIRFHKLESLTLSFKDRNWGHMVLNMTFPTSLKKLTLYGGDLDWKDLEMIGSLPNLEVLKLRYCDVEGSEWNPVEGEFLCLRFLQILGCNLTTWNADYFHFPVLETFVLTHLDEIPLSIGEIPTLRIIRLSYCSAPTVFSAVKILEEQESSGNEDLQVEVQFYYDKEHDRCIEMMEEEGFTCKNVHIKHLFF